MVVAILTATPVDADDEPPVVGVYTKGEHGIDKILDRLWEIYKTGLTNILGGKGQLEAQLNNLFLKCLLPSINVWCEYGKIDKHNTKKALLRYTLNHLVAELEGTEIPFFPEEVYLTPLLDDSLKTGSIVRCKEELTVHVVMTPACDLIIRSKGKPKTDVIVVAEVTPESILVQDLAPNSDRLTRMRNNNDAKYYHWLPQCDVFESGFLDFRRLKTVQWNELDCVFDQLRTRIAPSFLKDVISRFSAFYARQGQPTIYTKNH